MLHPEYQPPDHFVVRDDGNHDRDNGLKPRE